MSDTLDWADEAARATCRDIAFCLGGHDDAAEVIAHLLRREVDKARQEQHEATARRLHAEWCLAADDQEWMQRRFKEVAAAPPPTKETE